MRGVTSLVRLLTPSLYCRDDRDIDHEPPLPGSRTKEVMKQLDLVEVAIAKERMKFSAGHFTIFSAQDRERIHGHDFRVTVTFTTEVGPNGMAFDYCIVKNLVTKVCDSLDEYLLLPLNNPYLKIQQSDVAIRAIFWTETLTFLPRDVKLLPIRNVTVEDLSCFILTSVKSGLAVV